jgi:[ribosomal protein S18]-alanine N-acetyltransferase
VQNRPATIADIPSIMNLEQQSATAGHWTEEQYRQALAREGPERLVLVAEDFPLLASAPQTSTHAETSPLGFLVAQHLPPEWELENIAVSPTARRKGLGKRLLDALLAAAKKTNSTAVFLEVRESNVAARSLYEKAGFEKTGRRKSYYTNPSEDAVLYRLSLP